MYARAGSSSRPRRGSSCTRRRWAAGPRAPSAPPAGRRARARPAPWPRWRARASVRGCRAARPRPGRARRARPCPSAPGSGAAARARGRPPSARAARSPWPSGRGRAARRRRPGGSASRSPAAPRAGRGGGWRPPAPRSGLPSSSCVAASSKLTASSRRSRLGADATQSDGGPGGLDALARVAHEALLTVDRGELDLGVRFLVGVVLRAPDREGLLEVLGRRVEVAQRELVLADLPGGSAPPRGAAPSRGPPPGTAGAPRARAGSPASRYQRPSSMWPIATRRRSSSSATISMAVVV